MPYARHPPETWAAIQRDYLAGDTADAVCRRYDVSASNFHKRSGDEGWRRADQPPPLPDDLSELDDSPPLDRDEVHDRLHDRCLKLADAGRIGEALRCARLLRNLRELDRADAREADRARAADLDACARSAAVIGEFARAGSASAGIASLQPEYDRLRADFSHLRATPKVDKAESKNDEDEPLTLMARARLAKARDKATRRGHHARAAELQARLDASP